MGHAKTVSTFIILPFIILPHPSSRSAQQAVATRNSSITALTVTPSEREILFGSQAGVFTQPQIGRPIRAIATELDHVHDLRFSPNGSLLSVAGGTPAEFGAVELWSWPERKLVRHLEGHDDLVYAVVWLGDGKTLVTGSADRTVRVWEVETGKEIAKLTGHSGPVLCLAVSPDGKLLCSGSSDQTIRVWDTTSWQLVRAMTNHLGPVHDLAFGTAQSEESREKLPSYLASAGGDSTVRIWQPEVGRLVRIVRHPAPVYCLAWSSTGQLMSGAKDGQLRTIDADAGAIVQEEQISAGWLLSLALLRPAPMIVAGDSLGEIRIVRRE